VVFGIFVPLPEIKNVINMKKIVFLLGVTALVASCSQSSDAVQSIPTSGKSIVIDVRSIDEWNNDGHANCSTNIPLDVLETQQAALAQYDTITFVCRSGSRAGQAADWAQGSFPKKVIQNGGAWENVACNK
jgi:rhodanese-related sulfurtransferase